MKKIEQDKIHTILSYYRHGANALFVERERERERVCRHSDYFGNWQVFMVSDVCNILSGEDIYEKDRIAGKTPYITATAANNGIGYFVSNHNKTIEKKCLSVNRNGSVGHSFYHPYYALYGNDTRKLRPKHDNKYTSIFLSQILMHQKEKYGYGYKMGTARLLKQKILLPATKENLPDWKNIELYMRYKELDKIIHILKYYSSN